MRCKEGGKVANHMQICLGVLILSLTANGQDVAANSKFTNTLGMLFVSINKSNTVMLGLHEVRQRDWVAIMTNNPSWKTNLEAPVELIDYVTAVKFCELLSRKEGVVYRLPTSAEWISRVEKDKKGILHKGTLPVFECPTNVFGFWGMEGNVQEWCSDFEDRDTSRDGFRSTGRYRRVMGQSYMHFGSAYFNTSTDNWLPEAGVCNGSLGIRLVLEKATKGETK